MYGVARGSVIRLIFYKPVYDYMRDKITFWQMARKMAIRWGALIVLFCGLFYMQLKPELDKQDRNRPAMVTDKQWDEMKRHKAEGLPIVRPLGLSDAQWENTLQHLMIVPGPPTVVAPFERSVGARSKLMERARNQVSSGGE